MNFDTAKQPWLNVFELMSIQILSLIRTWLDDEFSTVFGRVSAFATSRPVLAFSWTLSMEISSDVSVSFLLIHSQYEPMKLFGLWTMIRSWYQRNNVLREDTVWHPRLGRSSYLNDSTLSVGVLWGFEVSVFSTCCLHNSDPSSSVMENCPCRGAGWPDDIWCAKKNWGAQGLSGERANDGGQASTSSRWSRR